ncbi:MAG: DNA translocase FtsK [Anaerolineales bacterium]|nr:DNA translocase FtsK [Anaerolineales bacterium]
MAKRKARTPSQEEGNAAKSPYDLWENLPERIRLRFLDLSAIFLGMLTILSVLGLLGLTEGRFVSPFISFIRSWLGWGVWLFPVLLGFVVFALLRWRQGFIDRIHWPRLIAIELLIVGLLGLLAILSGMSITRAEEGEYGGLIGWGLAAFIENFLGDIGALILFFVITLASGLYVFRGLLLTISSKISQRFELRGDTNHDVQSVDVVSGHVEATAPEKKTPRRTQRLPRQYRKHFDLPEVEDDRVGEPEKRDKRLPPFEILDESQYTRVSVKEINQTAGLIEKTLSDFGLPVRVVDFRTGPSVTQYAVEPGYVEQGTLNGSSRRQKVRVSQITSLANDLALALSAPRVRIEAPVPGRSYVGIEVPNRKSSLVRLRPILESENFQSINSPLAITLGRDVAGVSVAANLATMPHLLIAGTTGSGKSVCITALATCLTMNNTPEDLRLVMIDPKMVELVRFNGLPHLMGKVETELERIVGVLRWCTVEMDSRYKRLEEAQARDIDNYNQKARRRKSMQPMPRFIVMIDELADLMMMVPDQTEHTLVRLAQMARATGIHLVVATQRPSTDVVTGLIKANFPARISFAVASSVDSRVILDTPGAETLLGRGDMLFLSPEAAVPKRLQGVFVSDLEIERLIEYWKIEEKPGEAREAEPAPWEDFLSRQAVLDDRDEILESAIELVRETRQASASMLQRRLRIGYPRAARLMDELEELGIIGRPQTGGRTREVLIGKDDDPLEWGEDDNDEDPTS